MLRTAACCQRQNEQKNWEDCDSFFHLALFPFLSIYALCKTDGFLPCATDPDTTHFSNARPCCFCTAYGEQKISIFSYHRIAYSARHKQYSDGKHTWWPFPNLRVFLGMWDRAECLRFRRLYDRKFRINLDRDLGNARNAFCRKLFRFFFFCVNRLLSRKFKSCLYCLKRFCMLMIRKNKKIWKKGLQFLQGYAILFLALEGNAQTLLLKQSVLIAMRVHPFPSRTR